MCKSHYKKWLRLQPVAQEELNFKDKETIVKMCSTDNLEVKQNLRNSLSHLDDDTIIQYINMYRC
jgi:hypothetical protein